MTSRENRPGAAEIVEAIEAERNQLAQLLHDSLCQTLGALALQTRCVERLVARAAPDARDDVAELGRSLQHALAKLQDCTRWLRSDLPSTDQLKDAFLRVGQMAAGSVPCTLQCPDDLRIEDQDCRAQVLRVIREGVRQAASLSGVTGITLRVQEDEDGLAVEIHADGATRPFSPAPCDSLLQHSARALGAMLHFEAASLRCTVPHGDTVTR